MLSSALSITVPGNLLRDRSRQNNTFRSTSQPTGEIRTNDFPSPSPPMTYPIKTFFENLLHLTPHRYITSKSVLSNRTKISSINSLCK